MFVFNGVFMRLGPDFSRFGHKDISCRRETECWTKLFSDSHMVSFYFFFYSACFFDIISSISPQA